ncbi:glutamate ABC transporter substrate-binding protein [Pseudomonas mangiferae]|uniref:Glutamate ABC transporter substrate-binding protein n=1 Tax=Pseudomonas mangiferae TaxID=2593654 RepID=A0A553GZC4_9PSED|nr:glutamate ABC transporter substrate-binding protein [Pseudomonas mangiferae]TRX74839.1 glutamate ABC transporter substrate-binding protein [Pseudomonas mangiferae]
MSIPSRLGKGLLALCATILIGGASLADEFPADSTMHRLAEAGKVRIGVKFDQPLFGLRNLRGKPEGFDIRIGTLIAEALGLDKDDIVWVETTSANREAFIQQNKVDMVIATFAISPKRKEVVTFAGPYIITGQDLLVRKGNPLGITGPDDMAGRKLCVINGSEGRNVISRNYPKAIQVGFDAFSKCAEAVKNGSVDAATLSAAVMMGYVSKEPDAFELVGKRFTDEPWGVGVTKGDLPFCEFIEGTLRQAAADGRYEKAYQETVGKYAKDNPPLPPLDPCS